jgi:hypothetical protein
MTPSFYYAVREPCTIVKELNEFVETNRDLAHWTPMEFKEPHWCAALEVPEDILNQDPFLLYLRSHVPFTGGMLRMDPWTNYSWHTDHYRGCSLNLLLTDPNRSCCLFRHSPSEQIHQMFPIVPVAYSQTHYMCLNTQIEHSVFNWDKERFDFTLHFEKALEEFTYKDLLKIVLSRR